ncbi:hypothetical protein [Leisingera sp. ANG-Vp]|uniref:hypothetical protein n=1 Tax=Leisingera sp. ANG-Vp TaxID=1577896 RepID=UPI00057CC74E|nr:hypothetical protein [Leisingera sp. ANG-Vp]KIC14751.1 hypothetical protein RA20_19720 [Leisingera sp. ANG-Vp]
MAWAGLFLGMIAGFSAAVLGYTAAGLPLWASVLLYPAAGSAVTVLATAALAWRSLAQERNAPQHPAERSPATA